MTRGWTLDQIINHEEHVADLAKSMAAMPSAAAMKDAETFYHSTDLLFRAVKSSQEGTRMWNIILPTETGRKVRWGMKLILVEKTDKDYSEFNSISHRVKISRLRRLVNPKYASHWSGNIPFIGTFWLHLTKSRAAFRIISSHVDLAKYTRSI